MEGWEIVSYAKWRYKLSAEERASYKARKQAEYRERDAKAKQDAAPGRIGRR